MALYQPGQGLNPAAIARLRGRKDVNKVFNDLPAEDYSKQWDSLLGQGAKKKLRCSHCTRPLKAEDSSARHLLCERCLPERHLEGSPLLEEEEGLILRHKAPPAPTREPRFLHLDSCTETAQARLESLPQTPSTAAANSEEDAEALSGEPSQPPPNDVVVTLKQRLLGIWIGPKGEQYNLSLSPAEPGILCSKKEDSPTAERIPLFLDVRDKLVWWGNNRSYFLDLTELTEQNDRLLWHDSGNGTAQEPKMEWKRVPSGAGKETVKTVRVKRWSPKPEVEVPLVEVPLKKNSNKISNKIPQVDRQEAEVRPKVIEPESQLVVKGGSPIQEVKQKSVPSQQKAETKLQVQPEQKEDFKASKVSSSSSGPMRKVPSTAKEVQSEKKVSGWRSAPSAEVWRPESRMEVDSKKRVVPTPSKKDVKGEHETTQEVKVWKPVETPKEEEKAKTAEPKQEAKVWRPVETPKEEVKAKTAEPKQEAKVWRPVETPKEEVKAKTAEPKQEAKVWRPVETPKEEVKAKTAEPKQEAKAKQEAKVWKVVQAPEEVRPVKPKEVPQSKQEVKVWRAVGEKDPPKETQKWEEKKHEMKLGKDSWIESWKDPETALADSAIKEITAQVMVPENKGFVWVDEWQERFSSTFGTVREFLESRPDKFLVTPTTGRGYRVALVKHEGPLKWKPRKHS